MAVFDQYSWIIAILTIAFCCSSFGNGANDVANSYATSVAARTLTMVQVGFLSICTEFVGAVALGSRVTRTIRSGIIDINHFRPVPETLILVMGCAEVGSATWLIIATRLGLPVSTTQTVVGAIVGAGLASQASLTWRWQSGSLSQIAASWAVAPLIAGGFAAILFGTIKYSVLQRKEPFKWAMRLIPFYLAFTASVLALFIIIEAPSADSLEEFGAGKATGIMLGVFFGTLAIAYIFFYPYFHRRLVVEDTRLRSWHIPLGPLLWRENPPLYWPDHSGRVVRDYSGGAVVIETQQSAPQPPSTGAASSAASSEPGPDKIEQANPHATTDGSDSEKHDMERGMPPNRVMNLPPTPRERFLKPTKHLPTFHHQRLWSYFKYGLLRGVSMDCVTYEAEQLANIHAKAAIFDNRIEHLWTYAQVASAMMMSIAHGSNDVANAVAPWVAAYDVWRSGEVANSVDTPIFILAVAGILLGTGFWFFGYHIIRALGNRITRISPTRGFSVELGSAITVLMASRLALPVSTTQCLVGASVGVALMNYDLGAVNWKQIVYIFGGWVLTLPCAGLVAGLLTLMALNTPHF